MAVAVRRNDGRLTSPDEIEREWKDRITQARDHRKPHEPTWLSNLAFAAGKHWQVWVEETRQMRHLSEVDPRYEDRDLYGVDKIREHVQAQLGELQADDERPQLLLAQEGDAAEAIQEELNDLVGHGWENEWDADSANAQADRLCLKLGVSAIRVRFDPLKGPIEKHVPLDAAGRPVTDQAALDQLAQTGTLPDGSLPSFKPQHEGRTLWEPLSAFNLLVPPGINHEDAFPWEIVVRPVPLDTLVEIYGDVAKSLVEDDDIASIIGITTSQAGRSGANRGRKDRLRNHVWLFTAYERPCPKYAQGREVVLASNQIKLLHVQDELPVKSSMGECRSGIRYRHWWRTDDSFWSSAFIEPLKDPQRLMNEVATGSIEIMRRGYPKTFVKEGTLVHNPSGAPLEVIELKPDASDPNFFAGIGPGEWMFRMKAEAAEDMAHASTLSQLRLGENPPNVLTLGQLALLNENEAVKRSTILKERKASIAGCVEDSVEFIRRYWPESKRILVAGDEGAIKQKTFAKSRIPDFYVVRPAHGAAKPRSQGAELTKVDAIWNAAVACGIAVGPNAAKWIEWYAKSLDAGEALELPEVEADSQADMARFENFLMLDQGEDVAPADYDLLPVHVPIHREAQNQARAAEDFEAFARIQRHIDASIQLTQANAVRIAAAQSAPGTVPPPAPPAAGQLGPPQQGAVPPAALALAAAAQPPAAGPPLDQGAPQ